MISDGRPGWTGIEAGRKLTNILRTSYVPGTVLDVGDVADNKR